MGLKVRLYPRERAVKAARRLRRMMERTGVVGEIREREFYIKPSQARRLKKHQAKLNSRKANRIPPPPRAEKDDEYGNKLMEDWLNFRV